MKEEVEYCMKCGNKNPSDQAVCSCGGRNFIFGRGFYFTKKSGAICDCGSNEFTMTFHINQSPICTKNYKCKSCNNVIGVQTYHQGY